MSFCDLEHVATVLKGKRVAIVGSGPGVLTNEPRFVDSHDVVVRVNNHKCGRLAGRRTDVHYSFYGTSIRKTSSELNSEGCKLLMCKCPNDRLPFDSEWHITHNKPHGVDFRYIYANRAEWWFCPTYVPTVGEFMAKFELLGKHVPTTGFAAILDVLAQEPESLYLTGFDFFQSGIHNVNERWQQGNASDPIGHRPDLERAWLKQNIERLPITLDKTASQALIGKMKRNPYSRSFA